MSFQAGPIARRAMLFALSLAALPAAFAAPPSARDVAQRVDDYMRAAIAHDQFSGSILVARDGVPVVSKGYGMANVELGVPNTPKTVYRIASLTKQFTALAVVQLRDAGKLKLTDPVCAYVESCPAAWKPVTLRHLLTHTSGIPNVSSLPDWDERIALLEYTRNGLVDEYRNLPLQFAPGTQFKYSNSGYYLLGQVIERASGQPYADYLREHIFAPLGMAHSGYVDPPTLVPNRATGYYWDVDRFIGAPRENLALPFSAGGIHATTEDLLRWDQALYTDKLVSRQSLEEIFTPALNGYGYGWHVARKFDRPMLGHSGSLNGFSAFLARYPTERLTVIVLANSDKTSATKVAGNLAAIAFGAPYTLPKPQVADALAVAFEKQGLDAALRQYERMRADPGAYNFDQLEPALNELTYALLDKRKVKEAIAVGELNAAAFPQSANAFDTLAEVQLAGGDRQLAIRNYEKSLQLDPENENAVAQLAKLR